MKDREFLCWIHERLEHVHDESPLVDYMHKLRAIIGATPVNRETPNIARHNSLEELLAADEAPKDDTARNRDGTPYGGVSGGVARSEASKDESQKWVEHVECDGSREHVSRWDSMGEHCSEPNCIINKPKDESKEGGA